MDNHVKKGDFIGYTATYYHIYYWDMDTKLVNTSKHVQLDEGINDLEIPTLNARQMWIDLGGPLPKDQEEAPIIVTPTLESQHTPFPMIHGVPVRVLCNHDTLGVNLGSCSDGCRVCLKYIITRTDCSKIKGWKNKFRGAYIFQIKIPQLLL